MFLLSEQGQRGNTGPPGPTGPNGQLVSMKWHSNYSKTSVTYLITSLFSYLKFNDIDFVFHQGLPGMMGSRGIIGEKGSKVRKEDLALLSPLWCVM